MRPGVAGPCCRLIRARSHDPTLTDSLVSATDRTRKRSGSDARRTDSEATTIARKTTQELVGPVHGCYVGRAVAPRDYEGAASGGVASALGRFLLERGIVQGVMAARVPLTDGRLHPEAIFATEPDQLALSRNSFNFDFQFGSVGPFTFQDLLHYLEENPGSRVAAIGLFCQLRSLSSMLERRAIARDRVVMIGLFCSHAPDPKLIHDVFRRVGADMDRATGFQLKTGGVGGDGRLHATSTITYSDGSAKVFKLTEYTVLKNLWFDAKRKCLTCTDMFAENADISLGDAWYTEIRDEPHKHNTVLARTPAADVLLREAAAEGYLELRMLDPDSLVATQRRVTGVFKVAGPARTRLARAFGINIPRLQGESRAIDYVHAALLLTNVRLSQSERVRRLLMRLPTSAFIPGIALMKIVETRLLGKLPKGTGVGEFVTSSKS